MNCDECSFFCRTFDDFIGTLFDKNEKKTLKYYGCDDKKEQTQNTQRHKHHHTTSFPHIYTRDVDISLVLPRLFIEELPPDRPAPLVAVVVVNTFFSGAKKII